MGFWAYIFVKLGLVFVRVLFEISVLVIVLVESEAEISIPVQ